VEAEAAFAPSRLPNEKLRPVTYRGLIMRTVSRSPCGTFVHHADVRRPPQRHPPAIRPRRRASSHPTSSNANQGLDSPAIGSQGQCRRNSALTGGCWQAEAHHDIEIVDEAGTILVRGPGLPVCLDQLRVLLDTDSAPPLVERDADARLLQRVYAKQLAVG
jgi:hypothetical protein